MLKISPRMRVGRHSATPYNLRTDTLLNIAYQTSGRHITQVHSCAETTRAGLGLFAAYDYMRRAAKKDRLLLINLRITSDT